MPKIRDTAQKIINLTEACNKEENSRKKVFYLNQMLNLVKILERETHDLTPSHVGLLERKQLIKELKIDPTHLEEALHRKELKKYYPGNLYAKLSNLFFEPITERILVSQPNFANKIHSTLLSTGIKMPSISYISITLFTTFLLLFLGSALGVIILFTLGTIYGILLGLILSFLSLLTFTLYPLYAIKKRKKEIQKEYPFIISHLAALSNTGMKELGIFKSILHSNYYKSINIEIRRIINNVTVFGYTLTQSLHSVAESTPSKELSKLFNDLANRIENKRNINTYLKEQSTFLLSSYKKKKYWNFYSEVSSSMQEVNFKLSYLITIIAGIIILSLDFYFFYGQTLIFLLLLFLAGAIGWSLVILDTYELFNRQKSMEIAFFWFVKDWKQKQNLKNIDRDYKILNPYVRKLINQYNIGIPLDKALTTFANDTDNLMIQAAISTVLEAKKHGANINEALDQITTSKMIRNITKLS
ncbi:MAG: hypothetical protein Q8Q35_02510 [Nanoarchaeota archaeon]|nr:hypothetical protein [Nanoarchaeota archaeon]